MNTCGLLVKDGAQHGVHPLSGCVQTVTAFIGEWGHGVKTVIAYIEEWGHGVKTEMNYTISQ